MLLQLRLCVLRSHQPRRRLRRLLRRRQRHRLLCLTDLQPLGRLEVDDGFGEVVLRVR